MTLDTYFHEFNLFAKSLYPSMHIFKIFGERYAKATSIQFHFFIFLWKECLNQQQVISTLPLLVSFMEIVDQLVVSVQLRLFLVKM